MTGHGFTRSMTDPCLYTKESADGIIMVIVWVDDLCVASTTQAMFDDFYSKFKSTFNSTTSAVDDFVGIEITRDMQRGTIMLSQSKYIKRLFKRHMSDKNTKEWKTPSGTSRDDASKFMSRKCRSA